MGQTLAALMAFSGTTSVSMQVISSVAKLDKLCAQTKKPPLGVPK